MPVRLSCIERRLLLALRSALGFDHFVPLSQNGRRKQHGQNDDDRAEQHSADGAGDEDTEVAAGEHHVNDLLGGFAVSYVDGKLKQSQ